MNRFEILLINSIKILANFRAYLTYETFIMRRSFEFSDASFELFKNLRFGSRRFSCFWCTHVRIRVWSCVVWRSRNLWLWCWVDFNRRRGFFSAVERWELKKMQIRRKSSQTFFSFRVIRWRVVEPTVVIVFSSFRRRHNLHHRYYQQPLLLHYHSFALDSVHCVHCRARIQHRSFDRCSSASLSLLHFH